MMYRIGLPFFSTLTLLISGTLGCSAYRDVSRNAALKLLEPEDIHTGDCIKLVEYGLPGQESYEQYFFGTVLSLKKDGAFEEDYVTFTLHGIDNIIYRQGFEPAADPREYVAEFTYLNAEIVSVAQDEECSRYRYSRWGLRPTSIPFQVEHGIECVSELPDSMRANEERLYGIGTCFRNENSTGTGTLQQAYLDAELQEKENIGIPRGTVLRSLDHCALLHVEANCADSFCGSQSSYKVLVVDRRSSLHGRELWLKEKHGEEVRCPRW